MTLFEKLDKVLEQTPENTLIEENVCFSVIQYLVFKENGDSPTSLDEVYNSEELNGHFQSWADYFWSIQKYQNCGYCIDEENGYSYELQENDTYSDLEIDFRRMACNLYAMGKDVVEAKLATRNMSSEQAQQHIKNVVDDNILYVMYPQWDGGSFQENLYIKLHDEIKPIDSLGENIVNSTDLINALYSVMGQPILCRKDENGNFIEFQPDDEIIEYNTIADELRDFSSFVLVTLESDVNLLFESNFENQEIKKQKDKKPQLN